MRHTRNFKALPFDPSLKKQAKKLRQAGILHEALLWQQLKRNQLLGLDFDRQKIIGSYIVDFFCAEKGVVLEADGTSHDGRGAEDAKRDAYLKGLGLLVIRIPASEVLQNLEGVMSYLRNHPALRGTPPREGNKT